MKEKEKEKEKDKDPVKIDKFHMSDIEIGSLILVNGVSSDSLVFDYLDFNLDIPIGLVITDDKTHWTGKIPDVFIFPNSKLDRCV